MVATGAGRVAQGQEASRETEREDAHPSAPLSWEMRRDPSSLSSYLLPAEELLFTAEIDSCKRMERIYPKS